MIKPNEEKNMLKAELGQEVANTKGKFLKLKVLLQ